MKIRILILIIILLPAMASGQESNSELLSQINRDIWIPFLEGVNKNKSDLYVSVHSKDFYWVLSGDKTRIMNFNEYVDDSKQVMEKRATAGIKTELDIRFLERNINNEFASEKCVIKYVSREMNGKPATFYGLAQIFSRRENGVWRKVLQYVNAEPASSADFEKASPM